MSEGSCVENLDVWQWYECLGRWFGLFQTVSRLFRLKNTGGQSFFFNSLLAGLTNHPYMVFPNLGPSLKLTAFYSLLKVAQVLKAQWRWSIMLFSTIIFIGLSIPSWYICTRPLISTSGGESSFQKLSVEAPWPHWEDQLITSNPFRL